jgi:hypothetical protein
MDKTQNAVRQVLMNELGLTRETVREEMRNIVTDTIERHVAAINVEKLFERCIGAAVAKSWEGPKAAFDQRIATAISNAVADYAKAEMMRRIVVTIQPSK